MLHWYWHQQHLLAGIGRHGLGCYRPLLYTVLVAGFHGFSIHPSVFTMHICELITCGGQCTAFAVEGLQSVCSRSNLCGLHQPSGNGL